MPLRCPERGVGTTMKVIREPRVYLVGRQQCNDAGTCCFLTDYGLSWQTDTEVGAERLVEAGGRVCYLSFGKGRRSNAEYIGNLIAREHGSVLEHAVLPLHHRRRIPQAGHELVRHRAGFGLPALPALRGRVRRRLRGARRHRRGRAGLRRYERGPSRLPRLPIWSWWRYCRTASGTSPTGRLRASWRGRRRGRCWGAPPRPSSSSRRARGRCATSSSCGETSGPRPRYARWR